MESALSSATPVKGPSEFQNLLETLKRETETTYQLTSRFGYMAKQLKQPQERKNQEDEPNRKEPESITEHLWEEIHNLRRANQDLIEIAEHLYSVVGG
jgi:hypothetical protein